ncbi:MAG TPA: hypothetical protein PK228_09155, partial [Saprospiraceae bacterium]|nr:hypothetical protein [Saprospiraceae bacterium]
MKTMLDTILASAPYQNRSVKGSRTMCNCPHCRREREYEQEETELESEVDRIPVSQMEGRRYSGGNEWMNTPEKLAFRALV